MGALFSSNKKKKDPPKDNVINDKDRAVLELKNSKDRLKKYKKKLEIESEKLTEQAKALIRETKKERALLVLKLKRFKEKEVSNLDAQLISILEMIDNVEWEYANMKVYKALKAGTAALNKMHEEVSYEDVATLLDETNEAIEMENQINKLLGDQLTTIDDEELQNELDELMGTTTAALAAATISAARTTETQQTTDVSLTDILPEVPNGPILIEQEVVEEKKTTREAVLA